MEARSGWRLGSQSGGTVGKPQQFNKPNPRFRNISEGTSSRGNKPSEGHRREPPTCYVCGRTGHIAKMCNRRGDRRKERGASAIDGQGFPEQYSRTDQTMFTDADQGDPSEPPHQDQRKDQTSISKAEQRTFPGGARTPVDSSRSRRNQQLGNENSSRGNSMNGNACLLVDSCFSCPGIELGVATEAAESTLPRVSVACGVKPIRAMPVTKGVVNGTTVDVLRDSGCSTTVMRTRLVSPEQMTRQTKTCVLIDGTEKDFPVAHVVVDSSFYIGELDVLCMDNPVYDVILGNVSGVREPNDPDLDWKVADSGLAVETRSQASQRKEATKPLRDLKMPKQVDIATAEEFRREQSSDTSLDAIRRQVSSGEIKTSWNGSQSSFLVKNGLLYREFKTGFSDVGDVAYQLVVPRKFRRQVLRLAHESILAGHLGAHKTAERILHNFFLVRNSC